MISSDVLIIQRDSFMPSYFLRALIISIALFIRVDAQTQVGVITSTGYVGDREVAWRIKIAGERLGWRVLIDEKKGRLIQNHQFDWVICMLPNCNYDNPNCPNYLMVFHPFNYLNAKKRFLPFYEKYDGYLLTIKNRNTLEEGLKEANKEFHYIPFYPTVYDVPYHQVELNNLMVMIAVWSNRLTDEKFKILYRMLSETGFARFYGVNKNEDIISEGYVGPIPFDGVSVIDVLQRNGIVLVLHSSVHNKEGIPSARIFEAAAASTVIISDNNRFVKEHFGDSVYYIDTTKSGENIFAQVKEHLKTILNNPSAALEKAKTAHQIFVDNFTMENQLLNLELMHQEVMSKRVLNE